MSRLVIDNVALKGDSLVRLFLSKLHLICLVLTIAQFMVPKAEAQDSRLDVYIGYSLLRPNLPGDIGGSDATTERLGQFILNNVLGWNAGATVRVTDFLGVTADFSGYYRSLDPIDIDGSDVEANLSIHSFLFGPRFVRRGQLMRPFAHALFGFGRLDATAKADSESTEFDDTNFAGSIGGGLDVVVHPKVSIRAIQIDYFPLRQSFRETLTLNNFRWGTGIVFRF